jgi:hypothetical protein
MIRSREDLIDRIASERTWRIKEIQELKTLILQPTMSETRKKMLCRAGVALSYAHWEGFIKKVSSYFLEYVAMQRLPVAELKNNFIALILKGKLDQASDSKKYSTFSEIVDFLLENQNDRARVPYKGVINTESNLSTRVLKEIIWCLGIEYSFFEVKERFIDAKLVNKRNYIAHGEEIDLDQQETLEIIEEVLILMETFKNLVENSATQNGFKKSRLSNVID